MVSCLEGQCSSLEKCQMWVSELGLNLSVSASLAHKEKGFLKSRVTIQIIFLLCF